MNALQSELKHKIHNFRIAMLFLLIALNLGYIPIGMNEGNRVKACVRKVVEDGH